MAARMNSIHTVVFWEPDPSEIDRYIERFLAKYDSFGLEEWEQVKEEIEFVLRMGRELTMQCEGFKRYIRESFHDVLIMMLRDAMYLRDEEFRRFCPPVRRAIVWHLLEAGGSFDLDAWEEIYRHIHTVAELGHEWGMTGDELSTYERNCFFDTVRRVLTEGLLKEIHKRNMEDDR